MKVRFYKQAGLFLLLFLVSLLVIPQSVYASPISAVNSNVIALLQQTDDQSALESIVTFSGNNALGAGYIPGETVHVDVRGPNAEIYACDATVDQSGAWSCSVNLWKDNPVTGIFYYKATGLKSGVSYTGSFNNEGAIKSVKLFADGKELADKAVIHPGTIVDAQIELESIKKDFSWSATKYQIQQKSCTNATNCIWKTVFTSPCLTTPEPDLKGQQPHLYVTISNVFKQTQVNNFYQLMATTYSDAGCKLVNGEQWYYADEFELKSYETKTDLVCTPAEKSFGNQFDCKVTVSRNSSKSDSPLGTVTFEVEKPGAGMVTPATCFLKTLSDGTSACSTSFIYSLNGAYKLRANFVSSNPNDENSLSEWQNVVFDIQTPVITITANALKKTYGESDPFLTYSTNPMNLYSVITGSLTREAGEEVGTYSISQGSLKAEGYTVQLIPATFTIEKARANIQASGFSGVYDGQPHGINATATGVNGEDLSALLTFGPTFTNVPGGNSSLSFVGNNNYLAETVKDVPVEISARELEITADVLSKVYGDSDPTFSYKITGGSLVAIDKITGVINREPNENAGLQMLIRGTLSAGKNYHITFISSWFKINKRAITITADPQSKEVGSPEPALTFMITDGQLVNGDMFSGALVRTPGETAGVYPIGQGSLYLSENYELSFVGSTFSVYESGEGLDADADGIINAADNCVFRSNKDQKDADHDGFGDSCDTIPLNLQANMVVPVTGSSNASDLNCTGSTTLSLADGSFVVIPKELCQWAAVIGSEPEPSLPAALPKSLKYLSAINLVLLDKHTPMDVMENKIILDYSLKIPANAVNTNLVILYWNTEPKEGQGDWVQLPSCPFKSSVTITKNNPADARTISDCTLTMDHKRIIFRTNFTGLFLVASR
ncbi:MAG: MBG domain-containing protein [Anaerolineaceae bacterium]